MFRKNCEALGCFPSDASLTRGRNGILSEVASPPLRKRHSDRMRV